MGKDLTIYGDSANFPTSLVMSGVESDSYWSIATSVGIKRLLVSYHYIQKKGKKFIRERLANHPDIKLMIDSGAYTFHTNEEEYKKKPMEYWENYLSRYVKFIRENKDIIFSCVELDIANIVGFDKVDEFRRKYFEPLKEEGILVVYVWHVYDGKPYWEEMCKKYDYVGFSLQNSDLSDAEIMKFVNIAQRHNALVHGFAVTRVELMSRVPFFTGDSTTWLVGTQYGELNWFDGRTMKRLKKNMWKRQYKVKFIKLGANWELAEKENPYELIRINLLVFKKAEEYIQKRIKMKMYWLKSFSKEGVAMAKKKLFKPVQKKDKSISEPEEKQVEENKPIAKPKKPMKKNFSKGTAQRDDLQEQGLSKFDEFVRSQQGEAPKTLTEKEVLTALPSSEWFDGDMSDYEEYAKALNVDPTIEKEDLLDILFDMFMYITNYEEGFAKLPDEDIIQNANFFLNKEFSDLDEAVEALKGFYLRNAMGIESFFNNGAGEGEDLEAPERPKERESYLEDNNTELVDMSEEELSRLLPPPKTDDMEEVSAYDEELRSSGIVAVRDEKGRFLKGQKVVRKPKKIYSDHFPKLACNTCYKAGECPEYKADMVCAFNKIFNQWDVRNADDIMDAMSGMVNVNLGRMQRLAMFEVMDGGMTDPALTSMIDQNIKLLGTMKQMQEAKRPNVIAQQKTVITSDGTTETTQTVMNPSGGGLLERIFMAPMSSTDDEEEKEPKDITGK